MIILKNTRHSRKEDWGCCKGAGLVHVSGVAGLTSSSTFTERISQTSRHTLRLHYKFFRAVAQKEPTRQKSTISPPPHLATSPPRHLATSPPDAQVGHLATSPFPHLTISPPRHVTISPRGTRTVSRASGPPKLLGAELVDRRADGHRRRDIHDEGVADTARRHRPDEGVAGRSVAVYPCNPVRGRPDVSRESPQ